MTRVFLSYAGEDGAVARRIASAFDQAGIELYWWQDEEQRGKRFVGAIEEGICSADRFAVLMSPDYLSSPWCRRERDLAIQLEHRLAHQFIYVVKVADTDYAESGFLKSYDWLDLTAPIDGGKLDRVLSALLVENTGGSCGAASPAPSLPKPLFRNRFDEVNTIVNALTTTGGHDLWLVISPPRMGKSWLLDRLQWELASGVSPYRVRLLDLREHPDDLRIDAKRLLGALLNVTEPALGQSGPLSDRVMRAVATEVSKRGGRQLYLLDSAERLDPTCAGELRSALTGIYQLIRRTDNPNCRLGIVIGSRRYDDWQGLGQGPGFGVRFHHIALTEFGVDVVHQALAEMNRALGADRQGDYANRLHQLSEGLPALLGKVLHWAEQTAFLELDGPDAESIFDAVARPFVEQDLLSVESLLPDGGQHLRQAKRLLELALRALVPYRLFTMSHLTQHVADDPELRRALAATGWSLDRLLAAVNNTALLKRPLPEPWQVIDPPIRRLLYRYFYESEEARRKAHTTARNFYEGWTVRDAGQEQGVVLVECLWHETMRMLVERRKDIPRLLPGIAADLAADFARATIYGWGEFSAVVTQRLRDDGEFQLVLREFDGLFDEIVESVATTIAGGT
jgi:hypothetical protein